MKRKFSMADFLEGIWMVVRAVALLVMLCFGFYLLKIMKIPMLVTTLLLAVYIILLCIYMIKIGIHVILHGYDEH